jgi:predicted enzyme related to lactoylglutathione lyase
MTEPITAAAVLFVNDVARVSRFYEEIVPMTKVQEEDGLVVLEAHHMQLVIHAIPPQYATPTDGATPPTPREDSYIKLCFPVGNLASARRTAESLGGRLWGPEKEWEGRGFRACDGVDPEGNVVQLREPTP